MSLLAAESGHASDLRRSRSAFTTGACTATSANSFSSLVPARLFDSRGSGVTVDGLFAGGGRVGAGSVVEVPVIGRGGVGVGAGAVVLNVTVAGAVGSGFVTVYPCGSQRPNASNLNFRAGQTVPNAVVSKVGVGGKVCVYTHGETDLIVDVNGAFPATRN